MKTFGIFGFIILTIAVNFGCSRDGAAVKSGGDNGSTAQSGAETSAKQNVSAESTKKSPCANIYNPVKDGGVKNYKMSTGGSDARIVQKYVDGESKFFEELTVGGTTVKHFWECTDEGLIAANPGSMMDSQKMKLEPKHVSGVTIPKDDEIKVGKTWATVYKAAGTSEIGAIDSTITVNNKVVALDDEVKVPAGTFKAAKIEMTINVDMKLGGNKFPTPPVKTVAWFAPNVGMLKNGASGSYGNAVMEYSGDK